MLNTVHGGYTVMDLIDILTGKADSTCTGKYFEGKLGENGVTFEYEYLDPRLKSYRMLFGNLAGSQAWSATIKTNARIDFKVGAHVKLQDGKTYEINSVDTDMQSAEKQAYRYFAFPAGVYKVIRLSQAKEPFNVT